MESRTYDPTELEHPTSSGDLARITAATTTAFIRATLGEPDLSVGIVLSIQTHGSLLNWRPHTQALVTDGGFRPDGTFVPMPVHATDVLQEGWQEGLEQGVLAGTRSGLLAGMGPALELKFGPDGVALLSELHEIEDVNVLRKVADAIRTARPVEDLRRLC